MRVGCARPAAAWSILSVIAARASPAADCIRLQNIVWSVQDGAPARAPAAAALPRTPPPTVCPCRTAVPLVAAAQLQLKELLAKASTCPCRPAALCQISTVTSVAGRAAEKIVSLSTKCLRWCSAVPIASAGLLVRSYVEKVACRAVGAGRDGSGELPALPVTGALKVEHAYTRSARLEDAALRDRSQVREAYPQPHASSARPARVLSLSAPADSVGSVLVLSPPSGRSGDQPTRFRLARSGSAQTPAASSPDAGVRPGSRA